MASDTGLSSSSRSLSVDSIVDGMGSGERHTLRTNCSPFVFRNQMAGIPCQGEAQIPASDSTLILPPRLSLEPSPAGSVPTASTVSIVISATSITGGPASIRNTRLTVPTAIRSASSMRSDNGSPQVLANALVAMVTAKKAMLTNLMNTLGTPVR